MSPTPPPIRRSDSDPDPDPIPPPEHKQPLEAIKFPFRVVLAYNGLLFTIMSSIVGQPEGVAMAVFLALSFFFNLYLIIAHYWPKRIKLPIDESDDNGARRTNRKKKPSKKPSLIVGIIDCVFVLVLLIVVICNSFVRWRWNPFQVWVTIGGSISLGLHSYFALLEAGILFYYRRSSAPRCPTCDNHLPRVSHRYTNVGRNHHASNTQAATDNAPRTSTLLQRSVIVVPAPESDSMSGILVQDHHHDNDTKADEDRSWEAEA